MSLDKNRILVECECGLIFRLKEDETVGKERYCHLVPERDLSVRRKACLGKPPAKTVKRKPKK